MNKVNYSLLSPAELVSPQTISNMGRNITPDYESYLESYSDQFPAMEQAQWERQQIIEQNKLNELARRQATADSRRAMYIQGVNTLTSAYPTLKSVTKSISDYVSKPVLENVSSKMATPGIGIFENTAKTPALGMERVGGSILSPKVAETTGENLARNTATDVLKSNTTPTNILGGGKNIAKTGIASLGSSFAGSAAGYGVEKSNFGEFMHKKNLGGEKEWDVAGGAAAGAAAGSVVPGVGTLAGAIIGGISGGVKNACIIVTTCTDPNSYEVNITREYRNKYLDKYHLVGYYTLAEIIVPILKKHDWAKNMCKTILVDKFIEYGEYHLGKTEKSPSKMAVIITESFLTMCKVIGLIKKTVTRPDGEVINAV